MGFEYALRGAQGDIELWGFVVDDLTDGVVEGCLWGLCEEVGDATVYLGVHVQLACALDGEGEVLVHAKQIAVALFFGDIEPAGFLGNDFAEDFAGAEVCSRVRGEVGVGFEEIALAFVDVVDMGHRVVLLMHTR